MSFLSVNDGTQILLTGTASAAVYEQAFFMVTYSNAAPEPTVGNRTVNFQVFDSTFASNVASVTIAIQVIADSPVIVSSCGEVPVLYMEESDPVTVAPNLMLMDADVDHMLTESRVEVLSAAEGDFLTVNERLETLQLKQETDTVVSITGPGNVQQFQVWLSTNCTSVAS